MQKTRAKTNFDFPITAWAFIALFVVLLIPVNWIIRIGIYAAVGLILGYCLKKEGKTETQTINESFTVFATYIIVISISLSRDALLLNFNIIKEGIGLGYEASIIIFLFGIALVTIIISAMFSLCALLGHKLYPKNKLK
jgi:membrane associated rhomboid family serine protease